VAVVVGVNVLDAVFYAGRKETLNDHDATVVNESRAGGAPLEREVGWLGWPLEDNWSNQVWVLKKSLNRTPYHLRVCRHRFSCLRSTKWWPAEPV
jgi:hypothetical protein